MKKIMIALAVAAVAAVTQAASINWSCAGKTFAPSSADPATNGRAKNYLVYAFAASDLTTVSELLAAGKIDDAVAKAVGGAAGIGRTGTTGAAGGELNGVTSEATYSAFLVAFDTYTAADAALSTAKYYSISDTLTGATYSGAQSATSLDWTSSNWGGTGWKAISTTPAPEPTSGLLLLLGVAGLALRRKQK